MRSLFLFCAISALELSIFLLLAISLSAQVPRTISLQLYLEQNNQPLNGSHTLDVRWYDQIAGSAALHSETINTTIELGITSIKLGEAVPFPDSLLLRGPLWIGISVDGDVELMPRTAILSVPYAIMSDRARIAQALAPEVTGVVTSINEIAGVVRVIGGAGITVTRKGRELEISLEDSTTREIENSRVYGNGVDHVFTITPTTPLTQPHSITAWVVTDDTAVACFIKNVDVATNTITIVTSAVLLPTEYIQWSLMR